MAEIAQYEYTEMADERRAPVSEGEVFQREQAEFILNLSMDVHDFQWIQMKGVDSE